MHEESAGYAEQVAFDEALEATGVLGETEFGPTASELSEALRLKRLEVVGMNLTRSRTVPDLDSRCGSSFTYRSFIECGETQARLGLTNLPSNPDSYNALHDLAVKLLDPIVEYFGAIRLTYGFCSAELGKHIKARVAPALDQHAAQELNRRGEAICPRGGAACDFNKSLESLINDLVHSTKEALQEFVHECDELELHDLRMLDLARLDAEGESLGEYLTWLFSESVAAKARRLALPSTSGKAIPHEAIGFTGQLNQGKVLSDQFSEIVFGPPVQASKTPRFGELFRHKGTEKYLLVLTPACDLQRCEPTKPVLCVQGVGQTVIGSKAFAREKLYGKQDDGRLCHLFTRSEGNKTASTLITWKQTHAVMHTVQELGDADFERLALMNELFAQEVKEDVLRALGRVGTQIDPPPSIAYHAKVRWKWNSKDYRENDSPKDEFVSAVLTYSEQKDGEGRNKTPVLVLSDEFRLWIRARVEADPPPGSPPQGGMPKKLRNALDAVLTAKQLPLGSQFTHKLNELTLRVHEAGEPIPETTAFLQIDFWPA